MHILAADPRTFSTRKLQACQIYSHFIRFAGQGRASICCRGALSMGGDPLCVIMHRSRVEVRSVGASALLTLFYRHPIY